MTEYRGEIITHLGKGVYWNGIAYSTLEICKTYIDYYLLMLNKK